MTTPHARPVAKLVTRLQVERLEDRTTPAFTMTFEGLQNLQPIGNYYNGGGGPNYGVSFSGNALAIIDADAGGTGNFGGEPSPSTIAFFLTGGGALTMNVPAGFDRGFSFYYSAINNPGVIRVYDGENATGNLLTTLSLPVTPSNGGDPTGAFSPFVSRTVEFTGTAKSVDFGGTANQIGFDNITLGPLIEIQDYQMKKTDFAKVATLLSEAKVLDPATGLPTTKFNKTDNDRFFIVIDDKTITASTVEIDRIEITSVGRDGTTVRDTLPKLRLNRQADGRFISQPLLLVTDDQDDAFGGNEGTSDDLTIQAEAGGKLKIKYKDLANVVNEKVIDVSKPANVKKFVVNVTYIKGPMYSDAIVSDLILRASKVFSQADSFIEIKSVKGIDDPGGLADLDRFVDQHMTAEERQLFAINRDTATGVVNAYFVHNLPGATGAAYPIGYFNDPVDAPYTGSLVMRPDANYKTFAHELMHLVNNNGNHEPNGTGAVNPAKLHLMYDTFEVASNLFKKRLRRADATNINGSGFTQPVELEPGRAAGSYQPSAGLHPGYVGGESYRPLDGKFTVARLDFVQYPTPENLEMELSSGSETARPNSIYLLIYGVTDTTPESTAQFHNDDDNRNKPFFTESRLNELGLEDASLFTKQFGEDVIQLSTAED